MCARRVDCPGDVLRAHHVDLRDNEPECHLRAAATLENEDDRVAAKALWTASFCHARTITVSNKQNLPPPAAPGSYT
jgi:hypothetical protein